MLDTWSLVQSGFDLATCRYFEALLAIGSGPLQQRAVLEEGLPADPQDLAYHPHAAALGTAPPQCKSRAGTFMPGVTGPHPTLGDELINLPMIHGLTLICASERLDMLSSRVSEHVRTLDLRTGRLIRSFVWETRAGATLRVFFERFISAKRRHVMALRCDVQHVAGGPVELRFVATLDARVRTNGFDHFTHIDVTAEHEPITLAARTNGGIEIGAAALLTCDHNIPWSADAEARWSALSGGATLQPGRAMSVAKFAAQTSSRHVASSPVDAARKLTWDAAAAGFNALASESDDVWRARWAASDVEIDGDPESQRALRAAIYHVLRATVEDDPRVGVDASGWTSEAAGGRVTWEQDIFVLPMLLYTRPQLGAALERFRISTLAGARRNARREDYPGARYAWESTLAGDEGSTAAHVRDHAVHVSAAVAYGLWHACLARPGDLALLRAATEALTDIARYWCERVTYEADRGEYELLMVMGPDEYKPFSHNNTFTARMAKFALAATGAAWERLHADAPGEAAELGRALALNDDELRKIDDVAARLRISVDATRGVVLQSDDFFDYEPLSLERAWPDRSQPLSSRVRLERLYRSQVLQKADAVLTLALFPQDFDAATTAATYDAYERQTAHERSCSHAVHALVAARLGRGGEALRQWRAAVDAFLQPCASSDSLSMATAAALWHAVTFGFAGLRMHTQSAAFAIDPYLPPGWSRLRTRIAWGDEPHEIDITPTRE